MLLLTAGAHVPKCRVRLRTVGDHCDEFCYKAFSITKFVRLYTSPIDRWNKSEKGIQEKEDDGTSALSPDR